MSSTWYSSDALIGHMYSAYNQERPAATAVTAPEAGQTAPIERQESCCVQQLLCFRRLLSL